MKITSSFFRRQNERGKDANGDQFHGRHEYCNFGIGNSAEIGEEERWDFWKLVKFLENERNFLTNWLEGVTYKIYKTFPIF